MAAQPCCPYCGVPMLPTGTLNSRGGEHGLSSTRDHVIPRRYGGRITIRCCRSCNKQKADMTPTQWLAWIAKRRPSRIDSVRAVFKDLGIAWIEPSGLDEDRFVGP